MSKKIRIIFLCFLGLSFLSFFRPAGICGATDHKVAALEITGNQTIATGRILLLIQTKPGREYSENVLSEDVKRLIATGLFRDVIPKVTEASDGVKITLQVQENPTIKEVKFTGNKRYAAKVLRDEIGLAAGQLYDKTKLLEAKNKLTDYYTKKGFVFTEVATSTSETVPGQIGITFKIKEGVIARVTKVSVSGNQSIKRKKIDKILSIKQRNLLALRLGTFKEEALKADRERIEKMYKQAGFADVTVKSEVKHLKKNLEVTYTIEEGRRYILGPVSFAGNLIFPEADLRKALSKKTGDPYSEESVESDRNKILSLYRDKGYLKCLVEPVAVYNSGTNAIDLTYQIEPGVIVEVEEINITGNTRTKDKVIRREITLAPGDRFDGAKLRKSVDNLRGLNYFEDVNIQPQDGSGPDKTKLLFDLKENERTGNLMFGLGYSTVDDIVGFVAVEQRNFDWRNPPTFVGGGQNLRLSTELGGTRQGYSLSFFEPYLNDRPVSFGFDIYNRRREYSEYTEERTGGDLRLGWKLSEYWRASLSPRVEEVKLSDFSSSASPEYLKEEGTNQINSLTFGLTRDTRDSRLRTTTGTHQEISLKYAGSALGGDREFWKADYEFTYYHPLPGDIVFSARTLLGYAESLDERDVPVYERYFCGGAKTVRGYEERSLGPLDTGGLAKGGNFLVVENLELNKPIYENILSAVAFADIGQTFWDMSDFDSSDLKVGVGLGVRIKVPLFPIPIKLDYGFALDPLPGESSGRLHFSIDWWF